MFTYRQLSTKAWGGAPLWLILCASLVLLLAACAPGETASPSAAAPAADGEREASLDGAPDTAGAPTGPVIVESGGEVPFYARFGENETFGDCEWTVIVFYRPPDCIPADFNLNQFFHFPDETGPGAFGCAPPTTTAIETWQNGPEADPAPLEADISGGGAVPVWFVRSAEMATVMADGVVTIDELTGLPSRLVGTASSYSEFLRPSQTNAAPSIRFSAEGALEDGSPFRVDVSQGAPAEADHVTIEIVPASVSYPEGTLAAVLAADGRFTTLLALTDRIAGPHGSTPLLVRTDEQRRTLFAPTDAAFAALAPDVMARLESDPRAAEELLFHHLLDRQLYAKDFTLLAQWPTFLTVEKVAIEVDGDQIQYDGVPVSETDIEATNGVIHVVDGVAGVHLLTD